jgi:hypothetical protein
MAKWLIEARSSILRSTTRLELYSAVEWCLSQSRFTYDQQLSYRENAELARLQSLPALADVLELADKKEKRL